MNTHALTVFRVASLIGMLALGAVPAHAQFVGDFFFEPAVVTVEEGAVLELDVLTFTGPTAYGAARFRVEGDLDHLKPIEVQGYVDSRSERSVWSRFSGGVLSIANVERRPDGDSFGSVVLATLHLRVTAPAGSSLGLLLVPLDLLAEDGTSPWSLNGHAVLIQVVSAQGPAPSNSGEPGADPLRVGVVPHVYGVPLGRPGHVLPLRRGWATCVQTFDPHALVDEIHQR